MFLLTADCSSEGDISEVGVVTLQLGKCFTCVPKSLLLIIRGLGV